MPAYTSAAWQRLARRVRLDQSAVCGTCGAVYYSSGSCPNGH